MPLLSDTRGPAAPHQWSSRRAAPGGQVSQEPSKATTPKPYPGPLDPPDRTTAHPTHQQRRTTPHHPFDRRQRSWEAKVVPGPEASGPLAGSRGMRWGFRVLFTDTIADADTALDVGDAL
ncbi:hypothetical protein GCM10012280_50030 [Wenjunlia tyrosinilytica]|uniref:Uncharacterized protein n=1 Tax=Wenjunlia tyrosinilytica TaxID=1544741 RepID=A0A917ZTN0_9ACTN|nr:hypothetical protein GCM10012280_50030 [Wenjunlia tyrosinilytica]